MLLDTIALWRQEAGYVAGHGGNFWLRDDSLTDVDNLPAPGVIAAEIVEDITAALDAFTDLADSLEAIGDPE